VIPAISGAIGPLGTGEWSVTGLAADPTAQLGAATDPTISTAGGASGSNFGDALSQAISSLENTQANATDASSQLATGTATDPTKAVAAVENASLAMDYAAQIRNKLDDAATTIFQTQV
jgi:flagellar hook-basal body complex protein FliE